ncbi:diacylglyceryl transferase [Clostridia bacterium]|nr:diacylglyceryl transferase [Clostridia bacterium]
MFPSFDFLGRTIYMYPMLAAVGAIAAGFAACRAAIRKKVDDNNVIVFLLVAAIGVLIGGHLLYGLTQPQNLQKFIGYIPSVKSIGEFIDHVVFIFGGSVFYGGLLGGIAAGMIYLKFAKLDAALYTDIAAPSIPLFHAFGRIGCFLGGCCYGVESDFGFTYTHSLIEEANGVKRLPVPLIEMTALLILFAVLLYFQKKEMFKGKLIYVYLVSYAVIRFIIEFWRGDALRGIWFGLSTSQWISLGILVVCGIIGAKRAARLREAKQGRVDNDA